MKKKTIDIKEKFVNHLMKNGKKATSEKNILRSVKELQKISSKKAAELIKNALINSLPIFKINKLKNKKNKKNKKNIKEIPFFISCHKSRISLSIKLIIESLKKSNYFFKDFNKEILSNNQQKGDSIELKINIQKNVIPNKRYLRFYKWK